MPIVEPPPEIVVKVSNLIKCYGEFPAVDGISFDVRNSEVFGFLGPNGAGKTTTAWILTGVLKAGSGSAWFLGIQRGASRLSKLWESCLRRPILMPIFRHGII